MFSSCVLRASENTRVLFVEGFALRATVCVLYFKGLMRIYVFLYVFLCVFICVFIYVFMCFYVFFLAFSGLQKIVCTFCGGICVPRNCRATVALVEHIYSPKANL